MYKVIKLKGYNSNVTLINLSTSATLQIGRLTMEILNILERAGHKVDAYAAEIDVEVNEETAKELSALTMKMKKPIRTKAEKKAKEEIKIDANVDAFDLIFGRV